MQYQLKKPATTVEAFQMTKREGEHCNQVDKRDFSNWPNWLVTARNMRPSIPGAAWLDHTGIFRVHHPDGVYAPVRWGDYIVHSNGDLSVWSRAKFENEYEPSC